MIFFKLLLEWVKNILFSSIKIKKINENTNLQDIQKTLNIKLLAIYRTSFLFMMKI